MGVGEYGQRIGDQVGTGGRAEALRRFAEGRAMKTGTTIAGVVFQVGSLPPIVFLRYILRIIRQRRRPSSNWLAALARSHELNVDYEIRL